MFSFLLSFGLAVALAVVLYGSTRRFVRDRLRYVDYAHKSIAPWIAGIAAFLIGALLMPLPLVGIGTAVAAGVAVGSGVAAGARDIRRGTSAMVYSK